ncbi:hypothetical protein SAMN04487948_10459 [Halogranum amylolyticum]|uniref:Probable membrane transporter protein n=1 Tax=Halogranum amylolyticum TaxID=660520 RepID=A0A1H8RK01_9EURY|nr:sulfite exporter TauE/SafE family protein [Halogranum amylolyticum]SEO66508.1 hypothetical protein SAMN04487948_10459 [Halogranum amylolyticum]
MDPLTTLLVFAVVALGGFVTGLNGFGFAVVGTALLAALLGPRTAIVVMILPMLSTNVSLVRELSRDGLRRCVRRFWPYVTAALVGTVVGMLLLPRIPTRPLTLALGVFVFVYVVVSQPWLPVPGRSKFVSRCFRDGMATKATLGLVSGLIFGASNVGVQVVAYLRRLDLDRPTFVGVVAMIFLGVSTVRVGTAAVLGLYDGSELFVLSAVAALPGLVGVAAGKRARATVPDAVQRAGTYLLLSVIAARLTTSGLGL